MALSWCVWTSTSKYDAPSPPSLPPLHFLFLSKLTHASCFLLCYFFTFEALYTPFIIALSPLCHHSHAQFPLVSRSARRVFCTAESHVCGQIFIGFSQVRASESKDTRAGMKATLLVLVVAAAAAMAVPVQWLELGRATSLHKTSRLGDVFTFCSEPAEWGPSALQLHCILLALCR